VVVASFMEGITIPDLAVKTLHSTNSVKVEQHFATEMVIKQANHYHQMDLMLLSFFLTLQMDFVIQKKLAIATKWAIISSKFKSNSFNAF
jgi:hypothetical protein